MPAAISRALAASAVTPAPDELPKGGRESPPLPVAWATRLVADTVVLERLDVVEGKKSVSVVSSKVLVKVFVNPGVDVVRGVVVKVGVFL